MPDQVETDTRPARKSESEDIEHDPHYEPIINLPLVKISTNEEDEVELCKIRARLYRFDKVDLEWKERGTGDIKLLHHRENNTVRVVMRRDKTLKLCANHFISEDLQLQPHIGSDRAFNWTTFGDFADEVAKQEFLAIKFGNVENATLWKTKFNEAVDIVKSKPDLDSSKNTSSVNDDSQSDESSSLTASDSSADSVVLDQKSNDSIAKDESVDKTGNDEVTLKISDMKLENDSSDVSN